MSDAPRLRALVERIENLNWWLQLGAARQFLSEYKIIKR